MRDYFPVMLKNEDMPAYILLDVGGTQIKGTIVESDGGIVEKITSFPVNSKATEQQIISQFAAVIDELVEMEEGRKVIGVGMAFPGPFDYEKGICLMRGLDKYDSIYGLSIESAIKQKLPMLTSARFAFLHDIEAFAIGECRLGTARNYQKVLCLCIGTGAGSAFIENGRALKIQENGVPANGWLYGTPYKDSIIDDYLSVRALRRLSQEIIGKPMDGKELYELCRISDKRAEEVYRRFGEDLYGAIIPFIKSFRPQAVIMGGQISKSFEYFGRKFKDKSEEYGCRVLLEEETSYMAIQGLLIKMKEEN